MSLEENKAIARHYLEDVLSNHLYAEVPNIMAPDYQLYFPGPPLPPGPATEQMLMQMYIQAFPDYRVIVEDIVAEGEKVAARWRFVGTHGGEFQGLPATGRPVDAGGSNIVALRDGQICENWVSFDLLGLMQQLGAIPAPSAPPVPAGV